jgi:hypothetical protein
MRNPTIHSALRRAGAIHSWAKTAVKIHEYLPNANSLRALANISDLAIQPGGDPIRGVEIVIRSGIFSAVVDDILAADSRDKEIQELSYRMIVRWGGYSFNPRLMPLFANAIGRVDTQAMQNHPQIGGVWRVFAVALLSRERVYHMLVEEGDWSVCDNGRREVSGSSIIGFILCSTKYIASWIYFRGKGIHRVQIGLLLLSAVSKRGLGRKASNRMCQEMTP